MKKYLTIVLSLAVVLPSFFACKFSSDYMLDGELATANIIAGIGGALEAGTQEAAAPKIKDLFINGTSVNKGVRIGSDEAISFAFMSDSEEFATVEVSGRFVAGGSTLHIAKSEVKVYPDNGRCVVEGTLPMRIKAGTSTMNVSLAGPNGESNVVVFTIVVVPVE